jgi:hypothetical protein
VVNGVNFRVYPDRYTRVFGGQFLWSNNNQRLTWTPTPPLDRGSYSVSLPWQHFSRFKDGGGNILDGDSDGGAGGEFSAVFEIAASDGNIEVCDAGPCGTCPPLPLLVTVAGMIGVGAGNGRRRRR